MANVRICPVCGFANVPSVYFCEGNVKGGMCGSSLIQAKIVSSTESNIRCESQSTTTISGPPVNPRLIFPWGSVFVGERLGVGRDPLFSQIAKDIVEIRTVSRRHAELICRDSQVWVRDMGSMNGTYVNGAKVQETELFDGDRVSFSNGLIAKLEIR